MERVDKKDTFCDYKEVFEPFSLFCIQKQIGFANKSVQVIFLTLHFVLHDQPSEILVTLLGLI